MKASLLCSYTNNLLIPFNFLTVIDIENYPRLNLLSCFLLAKVALFWSVNTITVYLQNHIGEQAFINTFFKLCIIYALNIYLNNFLALEVLII
jgi:hypothetical protein